MIHFIIGQNNEEFGYSTRKNYFCLLQYTKLNDISVGPKNVPTVPLKAVFEHVCFY